jgi:hypothetical protein
VLHLIQGLILASVGAVANLIGSRF